MTAEFIKQKAKEYGATVCGIGNVELFKDDDLQRNPYAILPNAKSIIGFGIKVPRGLYNAMDNKRQYYNYTNLGVKYIDETFAEIFLLKMGALIENEGYDACLQRVTKLQILKSAEFMNSNLQPRLKRESRSLMLLLITIRLL